MKYNREYILERAFNVFMLKGYDSASISVLQKELDMSRGAMYRYFKNKEELFISVIDEYFFKLFSRLLRNTDSDITVGQLIELVYRRQKVVLSAFVRAGVTHSVFLNYTALIIQAAKYYPNFLGQFNDINRRLSDQWKIALSNSLQKGEIRSDINIDIMCILFKNTTVREFSEEQSSQSGFVNDIAQDIEIRKEVMDYMFSLIKIK